MSFISKIFGKKEQIKEKGKSNQKPPRKIQPDRIGDLGEYKINIQLDQFPKNYKHVADFMFVNEKAKSGFSQIDHILLSPYGIFVIETKNYSGEIVGSKSDKQWTVNKKHKVMNPFHQNYGHIQTIKQALQLSEAHPIFSMISFTRRATFRTDPELRKIQSTQLCVYDTELTEFINRKINVMKLQNSTPVFTDSEIEDMFHTLKAINITDAQMRENHKAALKSDITFQGATCVTCGVKVSEKVKQFCLSNKKFEGKIYCFQHQKR